MTIIDDPTAALGGLHGSKIFWEGLENNFLDFGNIPADHSTKDVIDPLSVSEFEFSTHKPQDVEMQFEVFKEKVSAIFEYKLFEVYTNGSINNSPINETSTTVPSEYILPGYPGIFFCNLYFIYIIRLHIFILRQAPNKNKPTNITQYNLETIHVTRLRM